MYVYNYNIHSAVCILSFDHNTLNTWIHVSSVRHNGVYSMFKTSSTLYYIIPYVSKWLSDIKFLRENDKMTVYTTEMYTLYFFMTCRICNFSKWLRELLIRVVKWFRLRIYSQEFDHDITYNHFSWTCFLAVLFSRLFFRCALFCDVRAILTVSVYLQK